MRQIDLMVSAKKSEWENHMHAVQIQLDKKTKELEFVKSEMEHKSQEVQDTSFIIILLILSMFVNSNCSFSLIRVSSAHRYNVHLTPENSEMLLSICISNKSTLHTLEDLGVFPSFKLDKSRLPAKGY